LKSMFVVPANSFDNVKGRFPIGFFIWDTTQPKRFDSITADIYDSDGRFEGKKKFYSYDGFKNINDWLRPTWKSDDNRLAYLACNSNDFQHQNEVVIQLNKNNLTSTFYKPVTLLNLIRSCIYFSVRKCIEATWLNDRDQFLYPNKDWETDKEFQNDCLAFTLFSNNIQSKYGTNHWIPFTEQEVNAREKFESNFMTDFIKGKQKPPSQSGYMLSIVFEPEVPYNNNNNASPLEFSAAATAVFEAGRALWTYYHTQPFVTGTYNPNASLYDIREYFQGRNEAGKMNNKSSDETYNQLIGTLRERLKQLAQQIAPKVYLYRFLKS